jgi:hypothetical protein
MVSNKLLYSLLDNVMSEYGWTLDYALALPIDVVMEFNRTILVRKKQEYQILANVIAVASNCGFSGKSEGLDRMFKDDITEELPSEEAQMNQLRTLWSQMGKSSKDFDEQLKKGKIRI